MKRTGKYALLLGFWGDWYAQVFLRYCLGSLLFPDNLPLVSGRHDVALKIATTRSSRKILETDPRFRQVCRRYNVEILTFPDSCTNRSKKRDLKYSVWVVMLNRLVKRAAEEGRSFLFLHGDSLYPDGFLKLILERAQAGMKMLFTPGVRIDAAKLQAMLPDTSRPIKPMEGQAFEAMTIATLHEFVARQYWRSEQLSYWPAAVLWRLNDEATIARFFDIHPIYVDLSIGNRPIKRNVDADYDIDVFAGLLDRGEADRAEVLACENGYYASITGTDEVWPRRLMLVGDDATAPLEQAHFPRTDSERFLHIAKWAGKYVPLKKILFFQSLYLFRTKPGRVRLPEQEVFEFGLLCDALLNYFPLLHEEKRPTFSLELPNLGVRIDV